MVVLNGSSVKYDVIIGGQSVFRILFDNRISVCALKDLDLSEYGIALINVINTLKRHHNIDLVHTVRNGDRCLYRRIRTLRRLGRL